MDFTKFLATERIPVKTPDDVVDENGKCIFGTFESEFKNMNFLNADKPSALPNFLNKTRLTLWEAAEINFGDIVLLTAVCNMFYMGTSLTVLYDKRTKKCTSWQEMLIPSSKAVISPNLLSGAESYSKGKNVNVKFINNFGKGEAVVTGHGSDKKLGEIDYRVKLTRVSKPSIVNIPFDENRPLYSQKDLFKAEGYIDVNGKRYYSDDCSAGIIDDHRGYYPRHAHYDWVTTLGKNTVNGEKQYFGFNLTRNQSVDQDKFNENLIWFEGETARLTPVVFRHEAPSIWHVSDTEGMVDLYFDIGDEFLMRVAAGIIDINYHITFGELRGFVCDESGNKYTLDGMTGIGEDKTLVF